MKNADSFFKIQKIPQESVVARYHITTVLKPETAAVKLCKEQSLSKTIGNDIGLVKRFSAKYISNSIRKINAKQIQVDVAFPPENCENSLSMTLSAVAGDTFNLKGLYPIKVMDLCLPKSFFTKYHGPRFGVLGIRKKLRCFGRPLLLGPMKPCVGLSTTVFAERAKDALIGGADIVKDDELICDPPYNRLVKRVKAVSKAVKIAEKKTGEPKMYFAFVGSDSPKQIMKKAEIANSNGADGLMVSPAINGFEIIRDLRDYIKLPVIAHNALMYAAHSQNHGLSYHIFAFLQRLCGADIVITPAKFGSFDVMTEQDHQNNTQALQKPIFGIRKAFPGFCGGQNAQTIPLLKKYAHNNDFIVVTGVALYDNPAGPKAGAKSLINALNQL